MKHKLIFLFAIFCILCKSQGEFIPNIDRTTGSFTNTGTALSNVTWVYPDDRAFDENTGTYIFPSAQNNSLISVSMASGLVIASPPINHISQFQFNKQTNKLHGLVKVNGNNTKNFVVINPATAAFTVIGNPIPGSALWQGCYSAMDNANNIYTFLDPTNILYSLNAYTGSVIASPTIALNTGENIYNIEFDNSTGKLYGILRNNNTSTFYLCLINKLTGAVTTIGPGSTIGSGNGSGAIDENSQEYMFLSSTGYSLTTFNMVTGSPVYNSVISSPNCTNFSSLKYDNANNKLYCIYWKTASTGLSGNNNTLVNLQVYPNPNNGHFKFKIDFNIKHGQFVLLNSIGQQVFVQEITQGENTVNTSGLASGLYNYLLLSDKQNIKQGKIVLYKE